MSVFNEDDIVEIINEDLELVKIIATLLNNGYLNEIGRLLGNKLLQREEEMATIGLIQHDALICSQCNGSGEGADGSKTCRNCGGLGDEPIETSPD